MPLGLKNAGATYQRMAMALLHDMMHNEVEMYEPESMDYALMKDLKQEHRLKDATPFKSSNNQGLKRRLEDDKHQNGERSQN